MWIHSSLKKWKKLRYWNYVCSHLQVKMSLLTLYLVSIFWFIITNWAQLIMAFSKCKAMIWSYLWCGQDHTTRARVSWANCCPKREIGRLHLLNLKEALNAFMTKLVLLAFELGMTNIKIMLRHCMRKPNSSKHKQ